MKTASESTAAHIAKVRALSEELEKVIEDFETRAEFNQCNWSHAGEVGRIENELLKVVARYHPEYGEDEDKARAAVMERVDASIS